MAMTKPRDPALRLAAAAVLLLLVATATANEQNSQLSQADELCTKRPITSECEEFLASQVPGVRAYMKDFQRLLMNELTFKKDPLRDSGSDVLLRLFAKGSMETPIAARNSQRQTVERKRPSSMDPRIGALIGGQGTGDSAIWVVDSLLPMNGGEARVFKGHNKGNPTQKAAIKCFRDERYGGGDMTFAHVLKSLAQHTYKQKKEKDSQKLDPELETHFNDKTPPSMTAYLGEKEAHQKIASWGDVPNVVKMLDYNDFFKCIIMEWVAGEPINKSDVVPSSEKSKVDGAVKAVVDALKKHGFAHGDLQERNIMYDSKSDKTTVIDISLVPAK